MDVKFLCAFNLPFGYTASLNFTPLTQKDFNLSSLPGCQLRILSSNERALKTIVKHCEEVEVLTDGGDRVEMFDDESARRSKTTPPAKSKFV